MSALEPTRLLYCVECKRKVVAERDYLLDPNSNWSCPECEGEIVCDYCGEPWTEGDRHDH